MTSEDLRTFAVACFPLARPKGFYISLPEYLYRLVASEAAQKNRVIRYVPESDGPENTVFRLDRIDILIEPGTVVCIEPRESVL